MEDARGRPGLGGRRELVRLIEEEGASLRAAARRLGVAPATAHRWWHRWRVAESQERRSLRCLESRPPTPRSCPWQLEAAEEARILEARARANLGPARRAVPGRDRGAAHPHPAPHPALERQGGALHPHPGRGVGPRARLGLLGPARPRPPILPALLQPAQAALGARGSAAHQPRSARAWAVHLGRTRSRTSRQS